MSRITLGLLLAGALPIGAVAASTLRLLHSDDFDSGLSKWIVEQQPGGTVTTEAGKLVIRDEGGCTVWFRERLEAPLVITYTVRAAPEARVSDINCFWMASDPRHPDDLFGSGHGRTGAFATYDTLRTYYVGYGGNANTTTRFRRYGGDGSRPLLPGFDLSAQQVLIEPGHVYRIMLVAAGGRAQFLRDGELIFDFHDTAALTEGHFGFRTVQSQLEIDDFRVWKASSDESALDAAALWDVPD